MENIQDTHISPIPTACISRLPGAIDTVSEVANAKVSQREFKGPQEFGGSLLQNLLSMTDM
jgi:hypothetical protein